MTTEVKEYVENKPLTEIRKIHGTSGKLLEPDESKLLFKLLMVCNSGEEDKSNMEGVNEQFFIQVIRKRIEVMKLPIEFTSTGIMCFFLFPKSVGAAVAMLIDCLTVYEGKKVDANLIGTLYPSGFYKEEALEDYIDNYLKPKKVKWSHVY